MDRIIAKSYYDELQDSAKECIHNLLDMKCDESCIEYLLELFPNFVRDDCVDIMEYVESERK